jgi:hypothetical protein
VLEADDTSIDRLALASELPAKRLWLLPVRCQILHVASDSPNSRRSFDAASPSASSTFSFPVAVICSSLAQKKAKESARLCKRLLTTVGGNLPESDSNTQMNGPERKMLNNFRRLHRQSSLLDDKGQRYGLVVAARACTHR